jgi:ribonuclease M5
MKEYIYVVEGKHDADKIRKIISGAICVVTNGTHITEDTIKLIKEYQKNYEIVLVLDPDFPGEKIRKIITNEIGACKHIYVDKNIAISKNKKKVGIEHISKNNLSSILENHIHQEYDRGNMTITDLFELGLTGNEKSKENRMIVGNYFHIGYANAKEMLRRLNAFHISNEQIRKVLDVKSND